ncbi:hypothetical protein [Streptomyces sp. NPDC050988]|uniref:hypothetical protein n=1 Tax=Streptomyces sp. NPDC050988 TaxID=3365637 RepID=UPI0037BC996C
MTPSTADQPQMLVEVTSRDRDTNSVTVYADPEKGEYRSVTSRAFGVAIDLPDPVGFTLETDELKEFAY